MIPRPMIVIAPLVIGAVQPLLAQRTVVRRYDATSYAAVQRTAYIVQRDFFHHDIPHYGKWVTAAGVAALTIMGAAEHRQSKRQWDQLLTICHSAQDACATGPDGRYTNSDAERFYQLSRQYDRRANHLLLGAQATLLVTTVLFIIDLHPGGPGNIPFPAQMHVGLAGDGGSMGMRVTF